MKKQCNIGRKITVGDVTVPTRCLLELGHEATSTHYDGYENFITFARVSGDDKESTTVIWTDSE